jgi:hypothetical protein
VNLKVIPIIRGATVSVSISFLKYLEDNSHKQSNTAKVGNYGKNTHLEEDTNVAITNVLSRVSVTVDGVLDFQLTSRQHTHWIRRRLCSELS